MMKAYPTEFPITRLKEEGIRKQVARTYGQMARVWLEWIEYFIGLSIQHQFNNKEKRYGPYRVHG